MAISRRVFFSGLFYGLMAAAGYLSTAMGYPAAGAILSDPTTAAYATTGVSVVLSVIAGLAPGWGQK